MEMERKMSRSGEEEMRDEGGSWRGGWGGGVVADFLPEGKSRGEEPEGSAGNSRARPSSRKALSAVIHYSATSTISLCQAIFTRSDKIDSVYKRMCSVSPPPRSPSPLIYLSATLMR